MSQTLSQKNMRGRPSRASLRASGAARTVLLAMAASEERAARIRELKAERPDLTWDRIAEFCGVKERSAIEWSRSGGITPENSAKLAGLFDVDSEWLWSGRERPAGTGDVIGALSRNDSQLDRIERKLDAILAHLNINLPDSEESDELVRVLADAERNAGKRSGKRAAKPHAPRAGAH